MYRLVCAVSCVVQVRHRDLARMPSVGVMGVVRLAAEQEAKERVEAAPGRRVLLGGVPKMLQQMRSAA